MPPGQDRKLMAQVKLKYFGHVTRHTAAWRKISCSVRCPEKGDKVDRRNNGLMIIPSGQDKVW